MTTREERQKARERQKRAERERLAAVRMDAPLRTFEALPLYSDGHRFLQARTADDRGTGYAQTHSQFASIDQRKPFIEDGHPTTKVPHTHLSVDARQLSFQGIINVLCHEGQHEALQRLYLEAAELRQVEEAVELGKASIMLDSKRMIYLAVEDCLGHLPDLTFDRFRRLGGVEWALLSNSYHFMGSCLPANQPST
jgi:hypothetical protein